MAKDLLQKALERDEPSAEELSRLYDYDIFTLAEAAQSIRTNLYGKRYFLTTIVILIQAIFAPMSASSAPFQPHAKIQIPIL